MLVSLDVAEFQLVALFKLRQLGAGLGVIEGVKSRKTVKFDTITAGRKCTVSLCALFFGFDFHLHGALDAVGHHTCQEPLPDEAVELILVGCQTAADIVRRQRDVRGADGLMAVLGLGADLKVAVLLRQIFLPVSAENIVLSSRAGLIGDTEGVGTHVGDETDLISMDIDTFVQFLGHLHGSACLETETPGGVLLQGGSNKRGSRLLAAGALFHRGNGEIGPVETRKIFI